MWLFIIFISQCLLYYTYHIYSLGPESKISAEENKGGKRSIDINIDISRKFDLSAARGRLRRRSIMREGKVPWEMQFRDVKEGSTGSDANHPLNGRLVALEQFARPIRPMKNSIGEIIPARFPRIIPRGIESLDNSPRCGSFGLRGAFQNGKRE